MQASRLRNGRPRSSFQHPDCFSPERPDLQREPPGGGLIAREDSLCEALREGVPSRSCQGSIALVGIDVGICLVLLGSSRTVEDIFFPSNPVGVAFYLLNPGSCELAVNLAVGCGHVLDIRTGPAPGTR
jgi:hypothetical protein